MLAAFFSGNSETIASVVSISPAIEAAFCNAVRAFDDGRRVLVHHHPLGATQVFELDTFE